MSLVVRPKVYWPPDRTGTGEDDGGMKVGGGGIVRKERGKTCLGTVLGRDSEEAEVRGSRQAGLR